MTAPDAPSVGYVPKSRGRKVLRFIRDHWIAHLTLLTLAALFVFPFLWMIGMSLKTDEEATGAMAFPSVPTFRSSSPYVIEAAEVERPAAASRELWVRVYPNLEAAATAAISKIALPAGAIARDGESLRHAASVETVRRGIARLDQKIWAGTDVAVLQEFKATFSEIDLPTILSEAMGRFELGSIQVRSLTGHVTPIVPEWKIQSGNAELASSASPGVRVLQYRFDDSSADPIVLSTKFDAGVSTKDLHRLIIAYRGDASWHHIDANLILGNEVFDSARTTYIAQNRAASLLLQPPTFQDSTLGPRNWVDLRPGNGITKELTEPGDDQQARLQLTIYPSSTLGAIWGKVERNYLRAFRSVPFWTYVGNSVILVLMNLIGALFSTGFVAYAFARLNWPGRSFALGLLLATMMLPSQVTMIPTFLIWRSLGWYNTLNPLWVPAFLGNAFFIFLMIQSMRSIPKELDEAARIDGMSAMQTWWYVIMPLVKPTLAAIAIMTFMGAWNDFMGPLVMLRDQTKFPLSLGLYSLRLDAVSDWPLIMSGNLLMTLPVIVIFFLFQRYFIEGVTVTGMKG